MDVLEGLEGLEGLEDLEDLHQSKSLLQDLEHLGVLEDHTHLSQLDQRDL
jgi:hypothetical protein